MRGEIHGFIVLSLIRNPSDKGVEGEGVTGKCTADEEGTWAWGIIGAIGDEVGIE